MNRSIPYLKLRDGRPRWEPGPSLRAAGFHGRDLKSDGGQWLDEAAAFAAADALNAEVATFRASGARRRRPPLPRHNPRTLDALFKLWQQSISFQNNKPSTRSDYLGKARIFLTDFAGGAAPVTAIGKATMHSYWEQLYRERGPSMAAGVIAVARAMLSYAVIKEWIAINPAKELMIETPDPRVAIWGNAKIAAMIETADAIGDHSVGDAIFLALHSGQRLGDVLAIPPRILEEGRIALTQFKTDALVDAPMTPQLRVRFAEIRARWRAAGVAARATVVAEEPSGRPYPDRHRFGKAFRRVRAECASRHPELRAAGRFQPGLAELRFQDLRDTAVTRLALAGCSLIQISAITGHAPDHIATVIKHYLALDDAMADQAIALLTTWLTKEGVRV